MPHLSAFSPRFAAPRHSPLWSGEGVGAATPIATPIGKVAAERLQPGAAVLGPDGTVHRLAEARRLDLPAAAHRRLGLAPPVLVPEGALGAGLPLHDIVIGPAQCLRLEDAWLPAGLLVGTNGIVALEHGAPLALLRTAGGAPLLAAGLVLASSGTRADDAPACVPAMLRLGGAPQGAIRGYVDHADRFGAIGWVIDPAAPDRVLAVEAEASGAISGGAIVGATLADRPRPDLMRGGGAGRLGRHGFVLRFARPLPPARPWLLMLRLAGGGPALPGAPLLIDAARPDPGRFDVALAGLPADAAAPPLLADLIELALRARHA